jgi:hypothetical protein
MQNLLEDTTHTMVSKSDKRQMNRRWERWKPTNLEIKVLEDVFEHETQFPSRELLSSLELLFNRNKTTVRKLKVWFQNRRIRSEHKLDDKQKDKQKDKVRRNNKEKERTEESFDKTLDLDKLKHLVQENIEICKSSYELCRKREGQDEVQDICNTYLASHECLFGRTIYPNFDLNLSLDFFGEVEKQYDKTA